MIKYTKPLLIVFISVGVLMAQDPGSTQQMSTSTDDYSIVQTILNEIGANATLSVSAVSVQENGRIVSLDLSNKDISKDGMKELPSSIGSLKELRTLIAKDNVITKIPFELFSLKNLRKLDLANNQISFIPATIGELSNLEEIDLRHNQIEDLPPEIGKLKKLSKLQLWGNKLTTIGTEVTGLPSLRELYLKDNRITQLPAGIMTMKSLTYIDFIGNRLCSVSPEFDTWLKKKDKQYKALQKCSSSGI